MSWVLVLFTVDGRQVGNGASRVERRNSRPTNDGSDSSGNSYRATLELLLCKLQNFVTRFALRLAVGTENSDSENKNFGDFPTFKRKLSLSV